MTIHITSAGLVLTKALRGQVRRRVLLAMRRFSPEVHGVTARLAVAPNPLGGVDHEFVEQHTVGFDEVLRTVERYAPSAVEHEVGIPAARIVEALRERIE